MNRTSIKIFFRNLRNHKVISFINITGLVLGITSTLLILEYVHYETTYDGYHKNAGNIYRVAYDRYRGNTLLWKTANSFFPSGNYLKKTFPEVINYFNITRNHNIEVSYIDKTGNKRSFFEEKTFYASNSIFSILTLPLLQGSDSCISAPYTVAISDRAASKYFNNENPIGKIIYVNSKEQYTVTGIYKAFPSNSHIKSDFLFSFSTYISRSPKVLTTWSFDNTHTYLQLAPGTDYKKFEKKAFTQMISDNYQKALQSRNERDVYYLQPIRNIHLGSAIEYETENPGNGKAVAILLGFSIFFLIIAWVNYINLVTARSIERAKEIGIRKVTGSSQKLLIFQFLSEALLFNLFCLIVSIILIVVLNPLFKHLTGIDHITLFKDFQFWIWASVIFIIGILLSGFYPAIVLSGYKPAEVLKGNFKNTKSGFYLRKGLVAFQFFVSLSMLIGAFVITDQVKFLLQKDKGYDASSSLVFKAPRINEADSMYQTRILLFRDKLKTISGIKDFTFTSDAPGLEINNWFACQRSGDDPNKRNAYFRTDIDERFLDFFKIKLLAGRNFTENDLPSHNKLLINLKALKRLGFNFPEEAIGKKVIGARKKEYEILGVVGDFNYYSTKIEAVPTIFTLNTSAKQYMLIKLEQGTTQAGIEKITPLYRSLFPGNAMEYFIPEDKTSAVIKPDKTFAFVFGLFSVFAVVIGLIGVLGLVIITINQNIKEMGVRKTLGADLSDFTLLLSHKFKWQLFVAILTAIPLSYFIYEKIVLQSYVYHINLQITYFLMPPVILGCLLLLIVSIISWRVTKLNPVETLRYE